MIYITGDIHREQDIHKINPREFTVGNSLTENDYVIICGDFGCICGDFGCVWDGSTGDNFWLKWLDSLPWNTLFIDGNHENFDVLNTYPVEEYKGGKVHRIRSKVFHLMRGEVFNIDGYKFFTMGGGFSHDVNYRTEHKNWWKDEICTIEEAKHAFATLEKNNWEVDYILSHDTYSSHPLAHKYETDMALYGDDYYDLHDCLETVEKKTDYKMWFSGHYHDDMIHYSDSDKPCLTLFDKVLLLDNIDEEIKSLAKI